MRELRVLLLFVALAVAATWPLAAGLGSLSRHDSADALLNEWILGWVAHALATDPRHLFDANIFFPERHTLAFSEHLLAQSILAAPLIWLGAPTLVAHNVALVAGFVLTGWSMAFVVARWTGDRWAGVLAGCLLAFNANTMTRLAHLQAQHVEFLPLALLALDRLLVRPQVRSAVALAGWSVLQSLCSGYLLIMTAIAVCGAALVRPREWLGGGRWRAGLLLAGAGLGAALVLAPALRPYQQVRQAGLVRPLDEVRLYSATPGSYLSTGARLHQALWAGPYFGPDSLFPGVVCAGLACVALVSGAAWRDTRARMLLAVAVAGVVLSFGPRLPLYAWLYHAFPPLQGLRGAARFGVLGLFGAAGLAGFGLAHVRRVAAKHGVAMEAAVVALALVAVNVEAWRAPIGWTPALRLSPLYAVLDRERAAAVLELPLAAPSRTDGNAVSVLASTRYGYRPLVNGYSGFVPASYADHAARLAQFPDPASHRLLVDLGVTHVLVHGRPDADLQSRASSVAWLVRRAQSPDLTLYLVR